MECWQLKYKFEELKSVKQPKDLTDRSMYYSPPSPSEH
jgi:hypothetical protein